MTSGAYGGEPGRFNPNDAERPAPPFPPPLKKPPTFLQKWKWLIVTIFTGLLIFIGLMVWATCTHAESVEPGEHAVLNDKPIFWGHEGVRDEPLTEGRMLVWDSTTSTKVSMLPFSIHVKFDDLSSQDNILLDFESTIQVRVTDAVVLTKKFGKNWFDANVQRQYMSVVREQVKTKTMTAMMSNPTTAQEVDVAVTAGLHQIILENKLPVLVIGVSLGRAKPNDNVLLQMNQTAEQQQRKKTLVEATEAERQRESEQVAKARADNAYRNAMNLSPEQFVELESIRRYSEACIKAANCIVTPGNSSVIVNGSQKK